MSSPEVKIIEERAKEVFKASFSVILLGFILITLLSLAGNKSYDYLDPRGREEVRIEKEDPYAFQTREKKEDYFLKVLPGPKSRTYRQTLYPGNLLLTSLGDLISAGLFVAVYRRVFEKRQTKPRDLFLFFRRHPLRNYLCVLVLGTITTLLSLFLSIPGYYFALVIFFYPLVLYSYLDEEKFPVKEAWKKTLDQSRGRKMDIFTKQFKYGVLIFALAMALGILLLVLDMGISSTTAIDFPKFYRVFSTIQVLVSSLMLLVASVWIYMATIEVFEEMKLEGEKGPGPGLEEGPEDKTLS